MPTRMKYRDQLCRAITEAQTDCGAHGRAILDLVLDSLHNVPDDIVFEVPTLREVMQRRRERVETPHDPGEAGS